MLVRAAATELPAINLDDALTICVLVSEQRPEQLERAALRWLGRYALERKDATIASVREAADAFARFDAEPEASLATLERLARR